MEPNHECKHKNKLPFLDKPTRKSFTKVLVITVVKDPIKLHLKSLFNILTWSFVTFGCIFMIVFYWLPVKCSLNGFSSTYRNRRVSLFFVFFVMYMWWLVCEGECKHPPDVARSSIQTLIYFCVLSATNYLEPSRSKYQFYYLLCNTYTM